MVHDKKQKWENITVSKNCPVDWNTMEGDEKIRFCGKCSQNVYNLSEMTQEQAEEVIQRQDGKMCIRLYRRPDGKIMTKDCPKPVIKASVWVGAGAAGVAILALAMYTNAYLNSPAQGSMEWHETHSREAPPGPPIKVVCIAKRLQAGDTITADALQFCSFPDNKVPINTLYHFNQAIGKIINYDCEPGTLVTEHTVRK
jgi:flagella basal body P-ring formation protein FlgA